MRDRLDGVAVFVETVEAGGFSRAAERLALSRSAVGKSIARLEARLGVRLFNRTTRVQILTDDGQAYYERCQRALDELRTAERYLESGRTEVAGLLRISMPVLFGRHCVAPLLLETARQHPKLELDLRFSDQVADVVGEGLDLAIRGATTLTGAGLNVRKLVDQTKTVCCAPAYLSERGRPETPQALRDHDTLVYWRNNQPHRWQLQDRQGETVEHGAEGRLRFDDLEAIMDAAIAGMGLAFLPDWLIREAVRDGRLVTLLDDHPALVIDTYAVWPVNRTPPVRLRHTIDMLVARLPDRVGL